jgi:hypothetical protein
VRVALLSLVGACGFSAHAAPDGALAIDGTMRDAARGSDDAMIVDAARPPEPFLLAFDASTLYQVDVDQGTATIRGSVGNYSIFAAAGNSTKLYAIPSALNLILSIDPASGAVLSSRALTPKRDYFGFTYDRTHDVWYAGTDGQGEPNSGAAHLWTIDPATGTATIGGAFGTGLTVAGDLAWVEGKGLYGSFYGPGCTSNTCIAKIDTTSGAATVLTTVGPVGALSMSGFRGELWALDTSGGVWQVSTTDGNATFAFATGIQWADGAN